MGTNHGKRFEVYMFQEDIEMMKKLVKLHPAKETGGNLFGLWNNNEDPVLHVVLGPAIGCTRTEVSFYQSIPYLERVGRLLTEQYQLCHIGEWHSHHRLRLSEPSSGDSSTVIRNFPRGTRGFILIIANILPNEAVTLSPYLYREGQTTYEKGEIRKLGSSCSPFKKIDAIKRNIEQDEDTSTTAYEYRLRPREDQKWESFSGMETSEKKACVYMFEEDRKMIENQLLLSGGTKIEGDLLGLWTSDNNPVLHLILEPKTKNGKEPQPPSSHHQPRVAVQRRGSLDKDFPLENIGKYIICPKEQTEPCPEDSSYMRREYPDGGILILVYRVQGESVAVHPYLYKKGSVSFKHHEMEYLQRRKVFSQRMDGNITKEEEGSKIEKMEIDDTLARGSPNFEQHKK